MKTDMTAKLIGTAFTAAQKAIQKRQKYLTVMSSVKDIDEIMNMLSEQGYITISTAYMGDNSTWENRIMITTRNAIF